MALSKATQSWKRYYYLLFTAFILALFARGGLYAYEFYLQKQIETLDTTIQEKTQAVNELLASEKFQQYLKIQEIQRSHSNIPWSDYVNKIIEILESIKAVDEDKGGVELSDFKVDLKELSLNGVVTNLRVLYGKNGSGGLLDSFNQLDFLSDISIRNYEKKEKDEKYYSFTLSAKVINNATTGSTAHK